MIQPELLRVVSGQIELAGVTRRQVVDACAAVPQVRWERLPLYTDEVLDGEPLQRFVDVKLSLELDEFLAVYEEFVAAFLLLRAAPRVSPAAWLTEKLGLTRDQATVLFSDGKPRPGRRAITPRGLVLATVALAAAAQQSYLGDIVESTATRFVVHLGGYRAGVVDGKPVTNLGSRKLGPRVAPVRNQSGLVHAGRGTVITVEPSTASVFAELAALGQHQPELVIQPSAWKLALSILRVQAGGQAPKRLREAIRGDVDPMGARQALRLAAGFDEFDDPYEGVRELLVPTYVRADEFTELFGSKPRAGITPMRRQQWRLALEHLSQNLEEYA